MSEQSLENLPEATRDELAAAALRLSGNAKTRKGFLKLLKDIAPETPIPEIDEAAASEAALAKIKQDSDEKWAKFEKDRLEERMAKEKSEHTKGLTEEQVKQMEAMMEKGELPPDYKWGSQLFKQQIESATPTFGSQGSSGWGPFELPSSEGLMENEQAWGNKVAHELIDEMNRQKSKPF